MEDAGKEKFELVMLDEYMVLFTCARIDRNTVPKGLHCYDVRHDDDCQGTACEVKPHVMVNHWGTILSKAEIPLEDDGSYYPKEDMNYLGESFTAEEYLRMDMEQVGMKEEMGKNEMNMDI